MEGGKRGEGGRRKERGEEMEEERRGWRKGMGSDSLDSCVSVSGYRMSMWRVLIL